jgi:ankyrin repeat protein
MFWTHGNHACFADSTGKSGVGKVAELAPLLCPDSDKQVRLPDVLGDGDVIQAVKSRREELVKTLVQSGWSANAVDRQGRSALRWAVLLNHSRIARWLAENGARPQTVDGDPSESRLFCAVVRHDWSLVRHLITKGAKVNARSRPGDTPLH